MQINLFSIKETRMKVMLSGIKRSLSILLVLHFLLLSTLALAEEVGIRDVEEATVTVDIITKIDKDSRVITLKNEAGEERTFTAGPEVRNFDQLKRGDLVLIQYYQGFAIALEPKGSGLEGRASEISIARAKKGEKPGMQVTASTYAAAQIMAVDLENRLVIIEGVRGSLVLKVADELDLSQIKVGQEIEALYTESFAVDVVPAPKVSGTVEMKFKAVALGIGVEWGDGTITMYDGTTHAFKISGMTVADVGLSSVEATGEVYNLVEAKDLDGVYLSGQAGAALVGGGATMALKNKKGVVMKIQSAQKGLRLTLAAAGLKIALK